MFKHKYTMLMARFNTYREHWNRTVRLIEDGKYTRNRFIGELHRRQASLASPNNGEAVLQQKEIELDRVYNEFREACKRCNLPVDKLSRDMMEATIAKKSPDLAAKLGTDDLLLKVVIEDGKPKIKASQRK